MERINHLDPQIRLVTARAIARMVGDNTDKEGPMRDLVDMVILRPDAFKNDDEKKAMVRLGMVVRKIAAMVDHGQAPELRECLRPEFWQTATGQQVHQALRRVFDRERETKAGDKVLK